MRNASSVATILAVLLVAFAAKYERARLAPPPAPAASVINQVDDAQMPTGQFLLAQLGG